MIRQLPDNSTFRHNWRLWRLDIEGSRSFSALLVDQGLIGLSGQPQRPHLRHCELNIFNCRRRTLGNSKQSLLRHVAEVVDGICPSRELGQHNGISLRLEPIVRELSHRAQQSTNSSVTCNRV